MPESSSPKAVLQQLLDGIANRKWHEPFMAGILFPLVCKRARESSARFIYLCSFCTAQSPLPH
jgi:hypothetical protein